MATVEQSIEVDVPLSTAYNQWTQSESFPHFMGGVDEVRQVTDTLTHWKTSVGGVDRATPRSPSSIPTKRVAWRAIDGETHAGVLAFHRLSDSSTNVMVQIDWETESLAEKAGVAVGVDGMQVKNDLKKSKEYFESRGVEEGGWRGEV